MGFFQNLFNRIIGRKMIAEKTNETSFVIPKNSLNQYTVDPSTLQEGKTSKDIEIDKAIEYARQGHIITDFNWNELNQTEIQAAYQLGYDLKNNQITPEQIKYVGGNTSVIEKMVAMAEQEAKANQYVQSEAHRFVPSGSHTTLQMIEEQTMQEYRDSFRIQHRDRVPLLNQLYNSAIEYGKLNNLTRDDLIKYASKRGATTIEVGGENPAIEEVDISAVISLAMAKINGFIDDKTIDEVGGPAELIDEMSAQAKFMAHDDNREMSMAKEYLEHPTSIVAKMSKVRNSNEITK